MASYIKAIDSLTEIEKGIYDTIIWDIRGQKTKTTLGGKELCPHKELEKGNHCSNCGAYKGLIREMELKEYKSKILVELAVSPSKDRTIIISNRAIGDEAILNSPTLKTPKYTEYVWLSKYGSMFDITPQRATYLIYNSKEKNSLSNSKFICNPMGFDDRLLNFGKTLVISPSRDSWIIDSELVDYYYDTPIS